MCANSPDYHDALDDVAAEEGTAAHWVFEQIFRDKPPKEDSLAPNGVLVTDEMLEFGYELASMVPATAWVEQKVDLRALGMTHEGQRDVAWHADGVAHIMDYKFGHKFVDEFENWQILTYFGDVEFDSLPIHTLNIHIYQPRCYDRAAHRVWAISVKEYREKYLPAIEQQIAAINAGQAPTRAGKQCFMCPAAASCPTLSDAGYGALDELYVAGSPHVLSPIQLARELNMHSRAEELLKARRIALEEQAHHVIRSGALVPGWERQQGEGRLAWTKTTGEVLAIAKVFGKDVAAPQKAVTPTQAIKAGLPEATVKSMSARPAGKMTLKKVDRNLARRIFAND